MLNSAIAKRIVRIREFLCLQVKVFMFRTLKILSFVCSLKRFGDSFLLYIHVFLRLVFLIKSALLLKWCPFVPM